MIKRPIPHSDDLLDRVTQALTPNRLPLLIAIDGADGVGKSSLASWLAWQLGMPAIQLDLYLTSLKPIQWLTVDLERAVSRRLDGGRPVIVEGVLVLMHSIRSDARPISWFTLKVAQEFHLRRK